MRPGFQDQNVCFSRHVDQRQHAVRSSQLAPRGSLTTASSDTTSIEVSCNAAIAKTFLTDILANGPVAPLAPRVNDPEPAYPHPRFQGMAQTPPYA
jgi:hypothetical protein